MKKKLFLNEFVLKIIALVTMTLDHIGLYLVSYSGIIDISTPHFDNWMFTVGFIFRIIGRIAFPLYIYMIIQGVKHTRNFWLYFMKLGIVGGAIAIFQFVMSITQVMDLSTFSSPFIDLMLVALMVYLLRKKNKLSILSGLPIALFVFTFVIQVIEKANSITILWYPAWVRPSYSVFGLVLGLGFYFASDLAYACLIKKDNREMYPKEIVSKMDEFQNVENIFSVSILFLLNFILFITAYIQYNNVTLFSVYSNGFEFANIQTFSVLAGIPLFFYNGKRGYNKPWFKYFNYLYFPLHIIVIFLIFYLIYIA